MRMIKPSKYTGLKKKMQVAAEKESLSFWQINKKDLSA